MSRAKRIHAAVLTLALLAVGGCGAGGATTSTPLGRAIDTPPPAVAPAPAPVGDPLPERHGTLPPAVAEGEDTPTAGDIATTPQDALRRYALAYTNWNAATLPTHLRRLAALAVGPARLSALQTAAAFAPISQLVTERVRNTGSVLAIAAGQGAATGEWVVVTREQTSGEGSYAGLSATPHVTLAQVTRVGVGWAVCEWWPRS
jgi:hypothetical protein